MINDKVLNFGEVAMDRRDDITQAQKEAKSFAWYKSRMNSIGVLNGTNVVIPSENGFINNDPYGMQINYDLYNGKLHREDMSATYKIGGIDLEVPKDISHRDIISPIIKFLEGMEVKRPFRWKVVATNPEATTRKEEEKFKKIAEFVVQEIKKGISIEVERQRKEMEMQMLEQNKVQAQQSEQPQQQEMSDQADPQQQPLERPQASLTPDQQKQIEQFVEEQTKAMTPPEVDTYMKRKHQDPAEILANQLLNYLRRKENLEYKFQKGWKHALITGMEVFRIKEGHDSLVVDVVNPLNFRFARNLKSEYIEDADWVSYTRYLTPSEIISEYPELTEQQRKEIYQYNINSAVGQNGDFFSHGTVNYNAGHPISGNYGHINESSNYLRETGIAVLHVQFRSLKKIGFLKYLDMETGMELETIVDENYKINRDAGDIGIEWKWIEELHEGTRIGRDIYIKCRPVPNQFKSISDYGMHHKLEYIGVTYDSLNSEMTSVVDRLKQMQYYYNVIMYRLEELLSSDMGKKVFFNMNMIPSFPGGESNRITTWLKYLKELGIGFYDPNEEGNKSQDGNAGSIAKEVDMSLVSDITRYMEYAEYVVRKARDLVGVNDQMLGQIAPNEAVRNTQQAISQSSYVLEPMFVIHNTVKQRLITELLHKSKTYYQERQPEVLHYVLDDNTLEIIKTDPELLAESSYGLFVSDNSKAFELKETINQLAHAAMQNQMIDMSQVIDILNTEDLLVAKEKLEESERIKSNQKQQEQKSQQEHEARLLEEQKKLEKERQDFELVKIRTTGEEERKNITLKGQFDLQKQAMLSIGFDINKDVDNDGTPDVLEVYKAGVDAKVQAAKLALDKEKLNHQKEVDQKNLELSKQKNDNDLAKINVMKNKSSS